MSDYANYDTYIHEDEVSCRKFTFQEVLDFIQSQPDERQVNFIDTSNYYFETDDLTCGCLMIQFGREKGLEFKTVSVKGSKFYSDMNERKLVAVVVDFPKTTVCQYFDVDGVDSDKIPVKTYGQLKAKIK